MPQAKWKRYSDPRVLMMAGIKVKQSVHLPPNIKRDAPIMKSSYGLWKEKQFTILMLFALEDPPHNETIEHEVWRFKNARDAGLFELEIIGA